MELIWELMMVNVNLKKMFKKTKKLQQTKMHVWELNVGLMAMDLAT